MATKEEQLLYWSTWKKTARYQTIEFYHPDFGQILLVANQFFDKEFSIDGVVKTFTPVHAEVPDQPNRAGNQSYAKIKFGRIGINFRQQLRKINQRFEPINCNLRIYEDGVTDPINEYFLFVQPGGIEMDKFNVTVTLGYDNPSKLSVQSFYDPSTFTGLQNL